MLIVDCGRSDLVDMTDMIRIKQEKKSSKWHKKLNV